MNLPNSITLARICCVPIFIWVLATNHFNLSATTLSATHGQQELLAAGIFLLGSLTDGVDGYLARRMHQVTTLGMLLSPLADKLLVATAYITLVRYAPTLVSAWITVLIVSREFLVTGMQSVAVQEKMTLKVFEIGKFKTVVQILSVVSVLMAHAWPVWHIAGTTLQGTTIAIGSIWLMLAVSLISASAYFRAFWNEAVRQSEQRRKPLPFIVNHPGKNVRAQ